MRTILSMLRGLRNRRTTGRQSQPGQASGTRGPRGVGAVLTLLGAVLVLVAASASSPAVASTITPPTTPPTGAIQVHAPTLTDHGCNATEWHFVINQVDGTAPSTITVVWSDGTSSTVPITHLTDNVAHYTTTLHLGDGIVVTNAWYLPVSGSTYGNFNLSHGPCGTNGTVPTTAAATTVPTTAAATTVPTTAAATTTTAGATTTTAAATTTTAAATTTTAEGGEVGGVSATGGSTLPSTGANLWPLGLLGGALLAVGMALVLIPNRRPDTC